MKITINSRTLRGALESAGKVINPKNATPILTQYRFCVNAEGNAVEVTGSDGYVTISESISANGEGTAVISTQILPLVRTLPDEPIIIETKDNVCEVLWSSGKSSIPAYEYKDYPEINDIEGEGVEVGANSLVSAINTALPCVGDDEIRPIMSGVFFNFKNTSLDVVATNSRILTIVRTPGLFPAQDFTIPENAVNAVRNSIRDAEKVVIKTSDNLVSVRFGNTLVLANKIIGKFPDYDRVIPKAFTTSLKGEKATFLDIFKRIATCANKASGLVKISLDCDRNAKIEAKDTSLSLSASESTDALTEEGNPLEIGFKAEYLILAVSSLAGNITFQFTDSKHAALLTCDADPRVQIILMPLSIE